MAGFVSLADGGNANPEISLKLFNTRQRGR